MRTIRRLGAVAKPSRIASARREGGEHSVTLELYDWFLSALYQAGRDRPLLDAQPTDASATERPTERPGSPATQAQATELAATHD